MSDMGLASLVEDLKASLSDAAQVFRAEDDGDFKRFLAQALPDMQVKRPVTKLGTVTLVADQAGYPIAETDFAALKTDLWRDVGRLPRPWEPCYPGALPRITAARGATGWELQCDPAPNGAHIAALGASCRFWYFAEHAIGETAETTTIAAQDRGLLLLRAQAEAMLAIAMRNATKPVQMRDGLSGTPRNSTPTALHAVLLQLFWSAR